MPAEPIFLRWQRVALMPAGRNRHVRKKCRHGEACRELAEGGRDVFAVSDEVSPARGTREPWQIKGRCLQHLHLDWDPTTTRGVRACKAVCELCTVKDECFDAGMQNQEPWGIWGGLTTAERRDLARERSLPPPALKAPHGTNARYARHGCRCNGCRHAHAEYERDRVQRRANP